MSKKTACVVYYTDDRYDELVKNVKNSFLSFHKDECDYYQIDYTNQEEFNKNLQYFDFAPETFLMQFIYAYEIMKQHNYEKVIVLGSDTIVCNRMDEFLDDLKRFKYIKWINIFITYFINRNIHYFRSISC